MSPPPLGDLGVDAPLGFSYSVFLVFNGMTFEIGKTCDEFRITLEQKIAPANLTVCPCPGPFVLLVKQ